MLVALCGRRRRVEPGRREHDDQRHDAQRRRRGRAPAGSGAQPRRSSGKQARDGRRARSRPDEDDADAGQQEPESCTPIMKRRKKMSLLPGTTSTSDPNVVRPNDRSSVTTQRATRARPATAVPASARCDAEADAANTVTTGQPPVVESWPVTSQPAPGGRRSRSRARCPRASRCAPPTAPGRAAGRSPTPRRPAPPRRRPRRAASRRHRSDGTRNGQTTSGTKAR